MAEFSASPLTDPNVDPTLASTIQRNSLANAAAAQEATNAQTFRDNAAGLIAGDPAARAAALGAAPGATTNYLTALPAVNADTRAQSSSDMSAIGAVSGAILNAPPDQRAALWSAARQQLIAGGHKNVPGEAYPGDGAMLMLRGAALSPQEQITLQSQSIQPLTAMPQPILQQIPGGATTGGAPGPGAMASPGGYNGALAQSESGGDPTNVNPQGYAGAYQFGTARLADLGMYQPAPGENVGANQWKGTLNIPGYPQVKTLADFRANVSAQNAVQTASVANIDQAIAQTPGAQAFDPNGLRAVAHLGGIAGMQRFVATRGAYNPGDSLGTHLSDYYRKFSGGAATTAAPVQSQPLAPPAAPAPIQVASAATTNGAPQTATDAAPPGPLPASLGAPPAPPMAPPTSQDQPGQLGPGGAPLLIRPQGDAGMPGAPDRTQFPVPGQQAAALPPAPTTPVPGQNPLTAAPPTVAQQFADPTIMPPPGQNALAGPGAAAPAGQPPNALAGPMGQPTPGTQGAPAMPGQAMPATIGGLPVAPPGSVLLGTNGGRTPIPIAGQPGYYQGMAPDHSMVAMKLPGAAGTIKTEIRPDGTAVSTDETGQVVRITPNVTGNTGRLTSSPDGHGGFILTAPDGRVISNTPSNTGHDLQMADYTRDQKVAQDAAEELAQAKQTDFAIREQRGITSGLTQTGAFGPRKAALASYLESTFSPATAKAFESAAGLDDASQSEQFAKTALGAAGAQENANVGARGGFQLTKLYTSANPGLGSQPNTIRDIQNLQAVSNLNQQDYLQGLLNHINTNSTAYRNPDNRTDYNPSTNFSQQWNSGNNPQVYVAAAEALNQKPFAFWSRGLSPADQARALSIAARADNTARYNGPNGPAALTQYGAPSTSQQAATPQPPQSAGAPAGAVAVLRQNPGLAAQFDAKYGQGASRAALGQ